MPFHQSLVDHRSMGPAFPVPAQGSATSSLVSSSQQF